MVSSPERTLSMSQLIAQAQSTWGMGRSGQHLIFHCLGFQVFLWFGRNGSYQLATLAICEAMTILQILVIRIVQYLGEQLYPDCFTQNTACCLFQIWPVVSERSCSLRWEKGNHTIDAVFGIIISLLVKLVQSQLYTCSGALNKRDVGETPSQYFRVEHVKIVLKGPVEGMGKGLGKGQPRRSVTPLPKLCDVFFLCIYFLPIFCL